MLCFVSSYSVIIINSKVQQTQRMCRRQCGVPGPRFDHGGGAVHCVSNSFSKYIVPTENVVLRRMVHSSAESVVTTTNVRVA